MLSHTVPDGVLKPGQAYRWRVRVADGDNWVKVQNRSHSDWQSFTTAKSFEYVYRFPGRTADGWDVASLKEVGVDAAPLNSLIRAIINRQLVDIHSILLVKNGKLVLEEYFYGYSRETKHLIASDTKSVTSILVGIAIDKQMISDVNKKVYEFFPEYKGT